MVRGQVSARQPLPEELPALAAIDLLSNPGPWSEQNFLELMQNPFGLLLASFRGRRAAGFIACEIQGELLAVDQLAVHPEFRRQGFAAELLREAVRRGEAAGCTLATLEVRRGNSGALAFYRAAGFECAGVRPGLYRDPPEDGLVMTLKINCKEKD